MEFTQYCPVTLLYLICVCVLEFAIFYSALVQRSFKILQILKFKISFTVGTNKQSRKVLSGISLHLMPSPSTAQDETQGLACAPGPDRSKCVGTSSRCYNVQINMDNGDGFAGSLRFSDEATFHVNKKCITIVSACVY